MFPSKKKVFWPHSRVEVWASLLGGRFECARVNSISHSSCLVHTHKAPFLLGLFLIVLFVPHCKSSVPPHESGLGFGLPKPVFPSRVGKTWEKLFFLGFRQFLPP